MSTNLGQYVTVRHVRLVDEPVTEVFRLGVHEEHNLFLFLQEWLEALHKGSITGDNLSLQPGPQGDSAAMPFRTKVRNRCCACFTPDVFYGLS